MSIKSILKTIPKIQHRPIGSQIITVIIARMVFETVHRALPSE